jgi:hypothetical protein
MNDVIAYVCAKCCCLGGFICQFCTQLAIVVVITAFGALVTLMPRRVIDLQAALYRSANWKLEPIDMAREVRNTRIMGLVVLVLGVLALGYILCS